MGYHWSPCNRGSGGIGGIVALILGVLIADKWHTITRAAITIAEVIAIAGSCLLAAGIGIAVSVAICRKQHRQLRVYQRSETGLTERLSGKSEILHEIPELTENPATRNIVILPIDDTTGYVKRARAIE